MKQKRLVIILIIVLFVFNIGTSFSYWANHINGASTTNGSIINIGDWVVVPPGAIVVTEEVLEGLLTGDPNYPTDGDYVLTGDVNLSDSGETFVPIENFTGTFSGNGFTISGFELDVSSVTNETSEVGMFLNVDAEAEISNVNVSNVTIAQTDGSTGNNTSETSYVGVIVGSNHGTLTNVQVTGSSIETTNTINGVLGSGSMTLYAGGLVGRNYGTIINSYARVNVILNTSVSSSWFGSGTGNIYVGGLVGYNSGDISKSYATGDVTSNVNTSTSGWGASISVNTYTGGLVGLNASGGYVHHVFATGNVSLSINSTSGSRYMGYVVGRNQGTTSALYRLSTASISANQSYTQYNSNTTSATSANLQSEVYLSNNLLFDFVDVWQAIPLDYPILKED